MEYPKTVKLCMLAFGKWPCRSRILNRVLRIFYIISFLSVETPILRLFSVTRNNIQKFIICFSISPACANCSMKYVCFIINTRGVLFLLDKILENFKDIESRKEFCILKKLTKEAKHINLIFIIYLSLCVVLFCSITLIPQIVSIILTLNETRHKIYTVELEYYFFDRNVYYWSSYVHAFICDCFSILTINIIDIVLFAFIQHTCEMYRVLWYRSENIMNIRRTIKVISNEERMQKNVYCILLHNNILEFVEKLDLCFTKCLLISYGYIILAMTILGAMIKNVGTFLPSKNFIQTIINKSEMEILIKYIPFTVGRLIHLCVPAQKLKDYSLIVDVYLYSSYWYKMTLRVRKFLLIKKIRNYKGKIFTLSMKTFVTVIIKYLLRFRIVVTVLLHRKLNLLILFSY